MLQTVRKTFLTPFDRGAITALIGAMDDTVDEMQATASAIELYEVDDHPAGNEGHGGDHRRCRARHRRGHPAAARPRPERGPPARADRAARADGKPCRRDPRRRAQAGASTSTATTNTLQFVVAREVYKHLERITDAFEDVADEIDGIVIEHA